MTRLAEVDDQHIQHGDAELLGAKENKIKVLIPATGTRGEELTDKEGRKLFFTVIAVRIQIENQSIFAHAKADIPKREVERLAIMSEDQLLQYLKDNLSKFRISLENAQQHRKGPSTLAEEGTQKHYFYIEPKYFEMKVLRSPRISRGHNI